MKIERAQTKRINFTKKTIEALPAKTSRYMTYDTTARGLGVMVQPSGTRSFFWFRKVRGIPTWRTIGDFPDLSVENARQSVAESNAKLARWKATGWQGSNPFVLQEGVTLGQLADDYVERRVKAHAANPERAAKDTKDMVEAYLTPLKSRGLASIRRSDVAALHARLGEKNGKVTANRVVQLVRRMFNWAESLELWSGPNPARGIAMFHEDPRTRFLQPDEMPRLFSTLRAETNLDLRDFVTVALFTGARRGDILSMRWENLSLADNRWEVPKPKNRRAYQVALPPEAVDSLKGRLGRREEENPFVFPSRAKSGHLMSLKKPWKEMLNRAKIANLTMHDLRRTFGAWQAAQGASLQVIGKSLGHASIAATQRSYSPLALDSVRASVLAASGAMVAASKMKAKSVAPAKAKRFLKP